MDPSKSQPPPVISRDDREQMLGHFLVLSSIGRGGMGEVFKAKDTTNGRMVAIKVLDGEAYKERDVLKRFEREARSALTLDHPNIAKFYGMERDHFRRPFIVMEYIEGESLQQMIDRCAEIPYSRMTDFIIQAAKGLESAYRRAIIHRDIKPSNIIVTHDDTVKIIDFGLAKSLFEPSTLTASGMVVGTPRYISPEQGMGRTVDHRSDIYSLGATFYHIATRQCPFDAENAVAIMMKHVNAALVPPYMINPKVPGDVNEIIIRMMAKDPGQRYQEYEPLIRDLESAKIHRLSKERRMAAEEQQESGNDLPQTLPPGVSPYLADGLVKDVSDIPAEASDEPSRLKFYIGVILLAMFVGFITWGLMKKTGEEPNRKSWLVEKLSSLSLQNNEKREQERLRLLAAEDKDKISQTAARMEAILSKLLEHQKATRTNEVLSLRQMRLRGMLADEDSIDAWGNEFSIDGQNLATLHSAGRDGKMGTLDDLVISADGLKREIPKPLSDQDQQSLVP